MEHGNVAPLLGAYALHARDDELHLVVAHLEQCGRCRAEVSRYERVLSLFDCP